MLCPICGKSVGDAARICDACAAKKAENERIAREQATAALRETDSSIDPSDTDSDPVGQAPERGPEQGVANPESNQAQAQVSRFPAFLEDPFILGLIGIASFWIFALLIYLCTAIPFVKSAFLSLIFIGLTIGFASHVFSAMELLEKQDKEVPGFFAIFPPMALTSTSAVAQQLKTPLLLNVGGYCSAVIGIIIVTLL